MPGLLRVTCVALTRALFHPKKEMLSSPSEARSSSIDSSFDASLSLVNEWNQAHQGTEGIGNYAWTFMLWGREMTKARQGKAIRRLYDIRESNSALGTSRVLPEDRLKYINRTA